MDTEIIKMYTKDNLTLREIARRLSTNHKRVDIILRKNNIEIVKKPPQPLTNEHKKNIGKTRKKLFDEGKIIPYNKGIKIKNYITKNGISGITLLYKNMMNHLRIDIELEWLMKYDDFEKLKFLNRSITRKRKFDHYDKDFYVLFINKFYYDERFNKIYNNWLSNNCEYYLYPSIDHIIPISKGGEPHNIDNIQFLTWFENRCKNNISQDDWDNIKKNIEKYFI